MNNVFVNSILAITGMAVVIGLGILEHLDQGTDTMTLDWADVANAKLFENQSWKKGLLDNFLDRTACFDHWPPNGWDGFQDRLGMVFYP